VLKSPPFHEQSRRTHNTSRHVPYTPRPVRPNSWDTTSDVSPLTNLDPLSELALTSAFSGERMTPENPACCETTYDDVLSSFTVRCNGGASFHRRRDIMPQDGQHHPNRQDDRHHRPEPPVCLLHLPPMALPLER